MPNGTAEEWEAGWRHGVDRKLDVLTELVQSLVQRMTVNEATIKDLRTQPREYRERRAELREWGVFGAIALGTLVSLLCGGSGLIISLYLALR